jgi:hypothetical protein
MDHLGPHFFIQMGFIERNREFDSVAAQFSVLQWLS